jgi:hypothetical protein
MQKHIYAVLWVDFGIPLHLIKDSAKSVIETAKSMHDKAVKNNITLHHLRVVSLAPDADNLVTLWEA